MVNRNGKLVQEEITFRPLSIDDLETIDSIVTSGFGPSGTRSSEVRRYFAVKPNYWLLASFQDKPAGVFEATDYGPFAYLGMMAVRKEFQRRGIGRALLRHVREWTEQHGIQLLRLDATKAGFPIYVRDGFEVVDQAVQYQRSHFSPFQDFPEGVRTLGTSDVQALSDFDTPVFGAKRVLLFRVLLEDLPDRAFASYDRLGRIAGFLFAQERRLGPWVARSPRHAEALLQAALTLPFDSPPLAIVPGMNIAALDLLERFGFRREREGRHMQRGSRAIPGERAAIYGMTSFALG
jgi:ribosomal protein S18 acetylase RimI-like enzyme